MAAFGFVLMVASYVFFDRYFYLISPVSYPSEILVIAAIPLKGAFAVKFIIGLKYLLIVVAI
ncbi:MAG: hypothetical protein HF978_16970 [Desulfobacteraceae bacterium]|nr:hypothetical protein [Desulfobacteraceae bacterium]MBC2757237.1 hypothetical protein [Desulfobacteraceae bacterium]